MPGSPQTYYVRVSQTDQGLPSILNSTQDNHSLVLFPNPATNKVLLMLKKDARVSVIDMNGRLVAVQHLEISGSTLPELDVSKLPVGVYSVIAEGEAYFSHGKITVVH